ncbi:MAG: ammonium transporter, partial [Alphaproteobacteria bacterium TMED110]
MINLPKFLACLSVTALGLVLLAGPVQAETTAAETAYVFNTLLFLMCGFLVMFMAAGFAMLESGMVRAKNVGTICVKNISLYSVAGIMFYLVGYNLLYGIDEGGYLGSFGIWGGDDSALTAETPDYSGGYSTGADWYFQMVFVATAASIVSGTVAERIKLWPFLGFVVLLTAFIYPIQASWVWGGGWLSAAGFSDFAGSTLVHS